MVALYAAINALIMLVLGILVVRARVKTRTEIGEGSDPAMMGAIRAHGNNTEYVPVALLLMLILIPLQANAIVIHAIGGSLTLGRILHAIGLSRNVGTSLPRFLGMLLTWISYLVAIVAVIWLTFQLPIQAPG
ncbi:MAG: MAPEG family protein [Rhizomicrobium sp.]